ncbi:hypothetical protein PENSPDRAFT_753218, partial [Peniophora sp. CONT]
MSLAEEQRREQTRLAWAGFFHSRFPLDNGVPVPELDYELDLLEEFTLLAKRRRNARIRASRLPAELLSMIFGFLSMTWLPKLIDIRENPEDDDSETDSDENAYDPDVDDVRYRSGWITVTHVCSQWRKVALSTPTLWCDVDCVHLSPCYRKIVFKNAKSYDMPIALTLDYIYKPHNVGSVAWTRKWLNTSISSRVHRLDLLNLPEDDGRLTDILRVLPALKSLKDLTIQRRTAEWEEPEPVLIPFSLPIPYPHQLERVSFLNCFPPLTSPIFSANLTNLSLDLMFDSPQPVAPSVDDVMDLLLPMHRLEGLKLGSLPVPRSLAPTTPATTLAPPHNTHVLPPSFRRFEYTGDDYNGSITSVVELISRLRFPSTTEINMTVDFNQDEVDHNTAYVHLVETIIHSINGMHEPSQWMMQVHHWSSCLVLAGRLSSTSLHAASIDWKYPLHQHIAKGESAHIHFHRNLGFSSTSALGTLRVLPLTQLTCLVLDSESLEKCFPSGDLPMPELLAASSLRRLSVELPASTSVFEELRKTRSDGAIKVPSIFPDLECITVQRALEIIGEEGNSVERLETLLSGLGEAVIARQHCRTPIRQLFINKTLGRAYDWQTIAGTAVTFFDLPKTREY